MGDEIDTSKWNVLYPNYLNSKKTVPEGRRIPLPQAVEHPHAAEMAEICEFLKIPHVLEMEKAYPRDWLIRGRVRLMLKTPEGAFTHPEIHNKKQLMLKMGELIPKLKSRINGPPPQAMHLAAMPASSSSASGGGAAAAAIADGPVSRADKKEAKREEKKANKKKGK
mmetsp:Transcript_39923/g.69136  ORF Transcript_39923/g.69136 Transcript_39923/m.69136 type:complete len:167 (-) Transcript_39923:76-576(-)